MAQPDTTRFADAIKQGGSFQPLPPHRYILVWLAYRRARPTVYPIQWFYWM